MNPVTRTLPSRIAPLAAALMLAFSPLSGCDRAANVSVEEHIQRAKDMNAEGNLKGVVIELKNAIQQSPDNPQARLMLGEAYLEFKLGDNAAKEFDRARNLGVNETSIKPLMGEALILTKAYQRVLDELQVSNDSNPRNRAHILQLRGDALLGLRKFTEACALYHESNQADPQWHKALTGIAGCDFAQGKISEARLALQQAAKLDPHATEAWIMLSKLERSQNQPQAARIALDNALKANNASLDALVERTSLLVTLKDFEAAHKDVKRMLTLYPKHFMTDYVQALVAFNEKKLAEAREHIARSLRTTPNYVPAMLLDGAIEFGLGNMRTAETHLARVVQNWPRHAYAIRLLAAAQLQQGDAAKAAKTLAVLNPEQSGDMAVLVVASDIALAQKNPAAASRYLEKAAALNPKHAGIRAQLGIARLGEGDSRALSDLMAAAALDPEWKGADKSLILGQIRQKNYAGALVSITTLEKKEPNSPEPWNYRGVVYLSQQNFAKARESFEQALKLSPGHFPSAANLAELDLHDKQPVAAKKRFESVLQIDKTNLDAMLSLAALAARSGDAKEYLARLEQAHKSAPQALKPLVMLSSYYLSQGDTAKALVYARQANDAHPNHVSALSSLGSSQLASGDINNALSTHKKLAELAPQSAEALLRLARVQLSGKQANDARTTLLKARHLEPENISVQDALFQMELSERKFGAALQISRQLQTSQSKSPLGFEREGDVWLSQGQAAQAVTWYEQALNRGQTPNGIVKLLRALHFSGHSQRADERLATWLTQHPQDRRVRAYAAEYYLVTERNRNAIAQYEYLIQSEPNQTTYLNNLATLYQREQDVRAQATAERALKLAPDSPGIQDTLGWILLEKGELTPGLAWLKKATSAAPRSASIRYHYAVALARSGNTLQAKKELQAILATQIRFPEAEAARKLLATQ
ncbi:MAG: XrtA/PEP-CTERM system TPR-repeat protein PrsT [Thiobacillaceae bacterium]